MADCDVKTAYGEQSEGAAVRTDEGKARLGELQDMLREAADGLAEAGRSLIVVLEGHDAAGKSGCARRMVKKLDEDRYRIIPISRPTEEEYRYHYLKRFWDTLPPYGNVAVYDRSWYGRVLVERVEGFASEEEWRRAYGEINAFEEMLTADGAVLVKLWLSVSEEEQLRRFAARMCDPKKVHKLTDEDWRNRARREQYDGAAADMFRLTDTKTAPWTVIDGDCKQEARIRALEVVLSAAEQGMEDCRRPVSQNNI